jgi:hypothetical protein
MKFFTAEMMVKNSRMKRTKTDTKNAANAPRGGDAGRYNQNKSEVIDDI